MGYVQQTPQEDSGPLSGIDVEAGVVEDIGAASQVLMIQEVPVPDTQMTYTGTHAARQVEWLPSAQSGLIQPPIWGSGIPATTAQLDATVTHIPTQTISAMSLLPPVTLPQFVADDAFDFLQAGYSDAVSLDQMPEPLWANATGGSGLSRLDPS